VAPPPPARRGGPGRALPTAGRPAADPSASRTNPPAEPPPEGAPHHPGAIIRRS